jgi:hypothetical protein
MNEGRATFDENDRRLLVTHYSFYRDLDSGKRAPTTLAQSHFVAVCRGTELPETDHERAYARFKQAVLAASRDEAGVVAAGFLFLPPPRGGNDTDVEEVLDVPVRPCASCGRPIPPERLEAMPEATRCVPCQQRTESTPSDWRVSDIACPRCAAHGLKSRMVWRIARDPAKFSGYFLGCSRFPECRYIDRS